MVLGLRSSEREKERNRELERAYLNSHRILDKTTEILQIYCRYKRLTLATQHINYFNINTGS